MQGFLVDRRLRKHGWYVVRPKREDSEFFDKLLLELCQTVNSKTTAEEKLVVYRSFDAVMDSVNKKGRQEILFSHGKKKEHLFWLLNGKKWKKEIWEKDRLVSTKFYGENRQSVPKVEDSTPSVPKVEDSTPSVPKVEDSTPSVPKVEDNVQVVFVHKNRMMEDVFGLLFLVLLFALWGIKYFV
ncbi:transmembrane domain-containing protein [Marseillevirus Shanghai 1]|nr:transmembrane domain-containing protein [Marseillevirus Shanghai 1]